ncbi:MAG TPA: hypothetical protein VFN70_18065 [Burkholderiales bacterium]|nr:hypothetical protein [Burkholderiales bacterium]
MAWVDLELGVLEAFAEVSQTWRVESFLAEVEANIRERRRAARQDYYVRVRLRPDVRARENAETSARRIRARLERAAARPPCPHCGAPVERLGRTAKIPMYCSTKCAESARRRTWWERNKDARNAARRKTTRGSSRASLSNTIPKETE